jgi:hypothetical protein
MDKKGVFSSFCQIWVALAQPIPTKATENFSQSSQSRKTQQSDYPQQQNANPNRGISSPVLKKQATKASHD